MFAGGSDETAIITGTINVSMADNPLDADFYWNFKLKVRIGNYYLGGTTTAAVWSTDSSNYIDINSEVYFALPDNATISDSFSFSITTAKIPEIGLAYFLSLIHI